MSIGYSIVIPVLNEEQSIPELYARLVVVMDELAQEPGSGFQLIFVDDGSRDSSFLLLSEIAAIDSRVQVIRFRKTFGKTAALAAGFQAAAGAVTITMDGDLQHNPEDIPRFVQKVAEGYDVVCGWREKRVDNLFFRRIPSRIANSIMRRLSRVNIDDFGGGFKAYRTSILKEVPLYGGMQRFIPALASLQGASICQLPIVNTPRRHGKSRYGISRVVPVFFDLLRISFLLRYLQQPLRFFGSVGLGVFGLGTMGAVYIFSAWLFRARHVMQAHGPLLVASAIALIAGVQIISIGLLGEMLLWLDHRRHQHSEYAVSSVVTAGKREDY